MKNSKFIWIIVAALIAAFLAPLTTKAARPNPPGIRGTVLILDPVQGPLPHVRVQDERGRTVADVEVMRNGSSGLFEIPLKKAGTYVVWAYQPPFPGTLQSQTLIVEVPRTEFVTVTLEWQPN